MEAFLSRSKVHSKHERQPAIPATTVDSEVGEETSTDVKLAILASLYPELDQETLLEFLTAANGSIESILDDSRSVKDSIQTRKRSAASIGYQTSLTAFRKENQRELQSPPKKRALTKKGQTLHLYSPEDIAEQTPCSIIHNFLPSEYADALLRELLDEASTFERQTFKLFDNVVQSPHSACFYVDSLEEKRSQQTEYLYQGSFLTVRTQSYPLHCVSKHLIFIYSEEFFLGLKMNEYEVGSFSWKNST